MAAAGYVSDEGYARMRGASLRRRGLGARRIAQDLGQAGIAADLRDEALGSQARAPPRSPWRASGGWGRSARVTKPGGSIPPCGKSRWPRSCGRGTPCHGARAGECSGRTRSGRLGL
jgi:hypothetical protein